MALNLQNAFSGSVINLDKLAEAKKNEYDSRVKALSGLDSTLAQLQRAKKSQEALSEYESLKQNMQGISDKETKLAELKKWLSQNSEDTGDQLNIEMDMNPITGADIDRMAELETGINDGTIPKGSSLYAEYEALNDKVNQRERNNLQANKMREEYNANLKLSEDLQKELANMDKAALQKKLDAYAWMDGPQFHAANAEYIRTGNSNVLTNLQAAYQNRILQEKQLAQQAADKEAEAVKTAQEAAQAKKKQDTIDIATNEWAEALTRIENDKNIKDADKESAITTTWNDLIKKYGNVLGEGDFARIKKNESDFRKMLGASVRKQTTPAAPTQPAFEM